MGVASRIGEVAKECNISLKELSRRADIPYTTLYNAVKRDSKMDFETVQKVADSLGVLWYTLYPTNLAIGAESYDERLAAACEWLEYEQKLQEIDSGSEWSTEQQNKWTTQHLDDAANLYDVRKGDLLKFMPQRVDPTDFMIADMGLNSVNLCSPDKELLEHIKNIFFDLAKLNKTGRQVAVERVHELAQLPKYQLAQSAPQDVPAGQDDKEPAEK